MATHAASERNTSHKSAAPKSAAKSVYGANSPGRSLEPAVKAPNWTFASIPVMHTPVSIQPKLEIGTVDDPLEREADNVAERVMRMSDATAPGGAPGECSKCKSRNGHEEKKLQMKPAGSADLGPAVAPPIIHEVLRSSGQPLDLTTRSLFEPRFGFDFSGVTVHTGARATESARAVGARAFTVGSQLVFNQGEFAPQTSAGSRLLAHELAHVVQQRSTGSALQRRAANCPDAPPSPPTITTMDQFIDLVRRVEAFNMTGGDPIATARQISRTKYDGPAWDWLLPSTRGQSGVSQDTVGVGKVTATDVASLCFKLIVSLPGGGMEDPMHVIAAIVADAETQPAGTGATGLSRAVDPLPASVTQRGASTWVGDVGKAAGDWMAVVPLKDGGSTKEDHMLESAPPHDLMADVDGVAITSKSAASGFAIDKTKTLSDNLQQFFAPAKRTGRERRFHAFCSAEGFSLAPDGVTLTDASKQAIGQRVKDFADWYTKNDPHVLLYVAAASRSWQVAQALVDRAGDWQWFADQFIKFVQDNLTAEGR